MSEFSKAVDAVVASLRDHPQNWRSQRIHYKTYKIIHTSGLAVRVFSGMSHMAIVNSYNDKSIYGGVTFLSSLGLSPQHWKLWRAAKRWMKSDPVPARPPKEDVVRTLGLFDK